MIEASDSVHMMHAVKWDAAHTDLTIFCDASLKGLGFVVPVLKTGFIGNIPTNPGLDTIFYSNCCA